MDLKSDKNILFKKVLQIDDLFKSISRNQYIWGCLLLSLLLFSCTDKDLVISDDKGNSEIIADGETYALRFSLNLGMDFSTRAGNDYEKYDNVVDTANMKIMFFDNAGDFLFEALSGSRLIEETADKNGQWYATIFLHQGLKDYNNVTIPLSLIKAQLEKEDFRIAILANWRNASKDETSEYKLPWGWENSKLNSRREEGKLRNVNDIHHLEKSGYDGKAAYAFLQKNNTINLGAKTNWVTSVAKYSNKRADAEDFIRENWNPSGEIVTSTEIGKFLKENYYFPELNTTSNLWQVWNFGGSFEVNKIPYAELARKEGDINTFMSNKWADQWNEKNGKELKDWLEKADDNGVLTSTDENLGIDGFYFVQADESKNGVLTTVVNDDGFHGIALGKTNQYEEITDGNNNVKGWRVSYNSTDAGGYIKIKAYSSGILRILWKSELNSSGEGADLCLQRGSTYITKTNVQTTQDLIQLYQEIDITGNPEDIYIFNMNNNGKAIIYGIEYICDQYLYDTDRQAVVPSEKQLIPMYGIQKYDKIDVWGSVKLLDLTGDKIELIRSIAKVEVYFPLSAYPKKIFMRSMNRRSHDEPMDVFNPTGGSWTKNTGRNIHDEEHCEWFDVKAYGHMYGTDVTEYQTWLKWFYGTWAEITGAPTTPDHPHVFNQYIDRSDYCEFYDAGEVGGMHKFVVYMPDKNIDDPNTAGSITATPKIAHIEYRYNRHDNYWDDNECKRIYFTDYTKYPEILNISQEEYDNEELKQDFLSKLWPVMRNHIYRFYINSNNETEEIRVSVNDWISDTEAKQEVW